MQESTRRRSSDNVSRRSSHGSSQKRRAQSVDQAIVSRLSHRLSRHASLPLFSTAVGQEPLPLTWWEWTANLVESAQFNGVIVVVVLLDFAFFFLQASKDIGPHISRDVSVAVAWAVAGIFTVEMGVKLWLYGLAGIVHNSWNSVDLCILLVTLAGAVLEVTNGDDASTTASTGKDHGSIVQSLSDFCEGVMVIRLVRVLRVFRIFTLVHAVQSASSAIYSTDLIRLPAIVCLDVLSRAVQMLNTECVRDYVRDMVSAEDVKWVIGILQTDALYTPNVVMDDSLEPEVKGLLGRPRFPSIAPPELGMGPHQPVALTAEQLQGEFGLEPSQLIADFAADPLKWDADMDEVDLWSHRQPLAVVAFNHFHLLGLVSAFDIDPGALKSWLRAIEAGYKSPGGRDGAVPRPNAFHNNVRQAQVVHDVVYVLRKGGVVDHLAPLEVLALVCAAVVADFRHPGLTNAFMAASRHPIALRYHESALENFHASSALRELGKAGNDFLAGLSEQDMGTFRRLLVEIVLSTDNTKHYGLLTRLGSKLMDEDGWNERVEGDRLLLLCSLLHTCDHTIVTKPYGMFEKWHARRMEEMAEQGKLEKELGLEPSMYMDADLDRPLVLECQRGMLRVLGLPAVECLGEFTRRHCAAKGGKELADLLVSAADTNVVVVTEAQRAAGSHAPRKLSGHSSRSGNLRRLV